MNLFARIQGITPSRCLWYMLAALVLTSNDRVEASHNPLTPFSPTTRRFPTSRTAFCRNLALCVRGGAGGTEESALDEELDAQVEAMLQSQTDVTLSEPEAKKTDEMPSEASLDNDEASEDGVSNNSAINDEPLDESPIEDTLGAVNENAVDPNPEAVGSSDVDSPLPSVTDDNEEELVSQDTALGEDPKPQVVTETMGASEESSKVDEDERLTTSGLPAVFETTTTTVLEEEPVVDDALEVEEGQEQEVEKTGGAEPETPAIDPATLTAAQVEEIGEQAVALRAAGKESHDTEDFEMAAASFGAAADLLEAIVSHWTDLTDEFATCRLHEALCRLKMSDYEGAIDACTDVLNLQEESAVSVAPALRARAYHRRAKARLELGKEAAALEDARAAAFLGDRKAVALYGKLMRGSSSMSLSDDNTSSDLAASSALFESLLSKTSGMDVMNEPPSAGNSMSPPPFSMPDLMGQMMGAGGGLSSGGNLAKSVLTSLSKRLEDEATQDQICSYLQKASAPQLQQMAGMAGFPLKDGQASTLANFCQKVTPRTIGRTVRNTKRAVYVVQLIRKVYKVLVKYRSLLVIITLLAWTKSALLRPIPINKAAARRAAKEAAKAAAQAAANNAASLV